MSESFQFKCPFCDQEMEVPPEAQGQVCKCPSCNEDIVPNKTKPQTTATKKLSKKARSKDNTKITQEIICKYCKQLIDAKAIRCHHCGGVLNSLEGHIIHSLFFIVCIIAGISLFSESTSIMNNAKSAIHEILAALILLNACLFFCTAAILYGLRKK